MLGRSGARQARRIDELLGAYCCGQTWLEVLYFGGVCVERSRLRARAEGFAVALCTPSRCLLPTCSYLLQGESRLRARAEGFAVALCTPSRRLLPTCSYLLQGVASAEASRGLCGRPLHSFASPLAYFV